MNKILHKMVVGRSGGEVPAASHPQRLIDRLFETVMGLLHIAVFMRDPLIVPGGLHAVMPHEGLVTTRPVFSLFFAQQPHGCTQVVGAMLLWNPTNLPEGFLNALGKPPRRFR